ncbi:MAG: response regulator transcription factor [Actinomycetes bacterium]
MRVLVVEDDVGMARVLRRGLAEEGYAVDTCSDGTDAVWQVGEFGYDAVVLDVMLPGRDGFEVCRELRGAGVDVPVLMLTARDGVADRVRGLDAGADDYLLKPFSFAELSARLRALLRRAGTARSPLLRSGDLWLDQATRRAGRGDVELALSAKEIALLELFLCHPGQILTRTHIRERLWESAFEGDSNIVDQYVSYLRRKVDRPFGRDDIQTVRGSGYRLRSLAPAVAADELLHR